VSVLPVGWAEWPLSELAEVRLGRQRAPMNHSGDQMRPYLRAANVGWGGLQLDDVKSMNFTDHEMATYRLAPGDLLLSEASGSAGEVGKPALWNGEVDDCAFQNTLLRVRPHGMEPRFLLHYFGFVALTGRFVEHSRGVGIHHLGRARLASWPTPKPPADEQRRIVDILEDHLSRLEAADRYVSSALRRLDGIAESTLRGFLTINNDDRPLGELLEIPLSNGRSVPTRDDGFPVLRLTALKDLGVDLRERKGGDWVIADARRFQVSRGDFLIARGNGSLRLVGRGSLVRDDPDEVAYPDTAIRARAAREVITPDFLDVVWNSTRTRVQIEEMARTTAGIYKVNQKQLAAVRLPIPSMADQRRIVGRMAEIDEQARRSHHALEQARTRGAVLRPALLAAAFSGRLTGQRTDQDVIEELASV